MNITFAPERRVGKQAASVVDPVKQFDEDNTRLWMGLQQLNGGMQARQDLMIHGMLCNAPAPLPPVEDVIFDDIPF